MTVISLQSGSNGNCTYLESGGTAILVDAGIAAREVRNRLGAAGCDVGGVRAIVISHDHADHIRTVSVLARALRVPVHLSVGTFKAARGRFRLDRIRDVRLFLSGETLRVDGLRIDTVPTPHDGADGVGLVVRDGRLSVGVLTDLGHVFSGLPELVGGLDALLVESNYDPDLLESGTYPRWLKARIRGPGGHLSNAESAGLLRRGRRLQWACLGHLSEENNRPDLALAAHRAVVPAALPLYVASRYGATPLPAL